jgi:hypothetical protein
VPNDPLAEGDKEHQLKLFQAWLDLKTKLAGWALIGNGAALTSAVAFIRDKGPESEGVFVLNFSAFGIGLAAFALLIVQGFADGYLLRQLGEEREPTTKLGKWLRGRPMTFSIANTAFNALIFLSAMSFMACVVYYSGVLEGRTSFYKEHPGTKELFEKRR